jgi:hypothetical protein
LALVKKELSRSKADDIDAPLLLLGLLYREVCRAMEAEEESGAPAHLIASKFGVKQLDEIEKVINNVAVNVS